MLNPPTPAGQRRGLADYFLILAVMCGRAHVNFALR
jgi:hypothetical protein